jgi:hypothetical protein
MWTVQSLDISRSSFRVSMQSISSNSNHDDFITCDLIVPEK